METAAEVAGESCETPGCQQIQKPKKDWMDSLATACSDLLVT